MAKYDFSISPPLMNAAGFLGFALPTRGELATRGLGAFVTNPVSLGAHTPAAGHRWLPYAGGFLLHTGYPNPGLSAVIRQCGRRWARASLPVIVHLLAEHPEQIYSMARRLERIEGVMGVEVGLPPHVSAGLALDMARAAAGERPAILRLPLDRAVELTAACGEALRQAGVGALSLGPPRGALPLPGGGLTHGRLYGPALFPQALQAARALAGGPLPLIAAGGIGGEADIQVILAAGAAAVQLDWALWRL
jgi:dihydroorotate dehydrogenase